MSESQRGIEAVEEEVQGYKEVLKKYNFRTKLVCHQVAYLAASAGVLIVAMYGVYYQYVIAVALMIATMLYVIKFESSIVSLGDRMIRDFMNKKDSAAEEDPEAYDENF